MKCKYNTITNAVGYGYLLNIDFAKAAKLISTVFSTIFFFFIFAIFTLNILNCFLGQICTPVSWLCEPFKK